MNWKFKVIYSQFSKKVVANILFPMHSPNHLRVVLNLVAGKSCEWSTGLLGFTGFCWYICYIKKKNRLPFGYSISCSCVLQRKFEPIPLEFNIAQPFGVALERIFDDVRFLGHFKGSSLKKCIRWIRIMWWKKQRNMRNQHGNKRNRARLRETWTR